MNKYGSNKSRVKHRKINDINDGIELSNESLRAKLGHSNVLPNVAGFFLTTSGLVILVWVGWLIWYDINSWGKDIAVIFFGSRTGEAISLGIGMKVIYYFLIGLALLLSGLLTLRRQSKHHRFGYLTNLPKKIPILQDLIGTISRARVRLITGLTLITILGVFLYLSPLSGNTVAVVGVFASLSAVIIALLATVEIEIINVAEENKDMGKTAPKRTYSYEIVNDAARRLDFSHTNMNIRKTDEFRRDIYSSENQITLSSHYAPMPAHLVKRQPKKRQTK